jgi:Spy/CpxP family protein refolding chaperone
VRKLAACFLFAVLALAVPLSAAAQITSNDQARIAAEKHNAKRSRKEVKARKHDVKKAQKKFGKPKRPGKYTHQTM